MQQQKQNKIPVYFVPGLAANTSIFEYIKLNKDTFEMYYLPWLMPLAKNETIEAYALRMTLKIKHKNPVLVGVSFGGIMVQEMSNHIATKKTIIISSVKTDLELPKRLKFAQKSKAYKLFPSKALNNIENLTKYTFGKTVQKRLDLYNKYMSMRTPLYLDWAIYNVLHWKQKIPQKDLIHIHGDADQVFPIKHIKNCIRIEGGTHVMILNKAKKITTFIENYSKK